MQDTYNTLLKESEGFYKEKGSKFIGLAKACISEAQAKEQLKIWKTEHSKAGHLCYAYRIGVHQQKIRSSDDGEPSNSAGAPIQGQIQSFKLTNVLIGVVRYYGGTKLGVGGLIQAYRQAAKDAIENNKIVEKELFNTLEISFGYMQMPLVMNWIKQNKIIVLHQDLDEHCLVRVEIAQARYEQLKSNLLKINPISIESEIIGT